MANTWNWLFGNDSKVEGTPVLQWSNMPESWGVFVLILVVLGIGFGVFWLYRREMDVCPKPIKMLLAALRLSVLLFLVALYLKPSIFFQQVNQIKPSIPLLRDSSLSVAKTDNYQDAMTIERLVKATGLPTEQIRNGEVNRADLLNAAINKAQSSVDAIRQKGAIQVIDFADGTQSVAILPSLSEGTAATVDPKSSSSETGNPDSNTTLTDTIPALEANGLGTDIWQALRTTLDKAEKVSAIVLISDFQHNGTENPVELAQKAASLEIPIYAIGVGDPNPPRNVNVAEVYVRNKAYPNEPFEIEGLLQVNNLYGDFNQFNVELQQRRVDPRTGKLGDPEKVSEKQVSVPEKGGRIRVEFEHVLDLPGNYVFSLAAEKIEGEINLGDNLKSSPEMEVVDEKVRVLLISGLPSWDYQQVQRLLQRDQNISLSCFLQSMDETRPQEGNEPITRLPETMDELREYNVVMMFDPNPAAFDTQWTRMLKEFCKERAGGLLYMAGPQFTTEFLTLNKLSGMRELLPVRFGDVEFIDTTQILAKASSNEALEMKIVDYNLDHPVMSFRADAMENKEIWNSLPGVFWSFPTKAPKPTARVLLENAAQISADGNQPLMVAGRYGAGSVLYLGFQGTWRWRKVGLQAQYFDRFWIQVIRYLVETRSLQGSRRGFLDSDKSEYELGDRVLLVARILDQQFQPATDKSINAIIRSDDGRTQTVPLKLLPQQAGRYEGSFIAQRTGNYEASIEFKQDDETDSLADPVAFRMVTPSAESGASWLNEKLMNEIAQQSGGKAFRLDQLEELSDSIPQISEKITFRSPPRPVWDMNYLMRLLAFCLPVVLLCTEWAIRKWYKLL